VLPGQSGGDQGPVYTDPDEPSSPGPRPRSPGQVIEPDDRPVGAADNAPQPEQEASGPRIQPVVTAEDEEEAAA
jgi:hypothetical protein